MAEETYQRLTGTRARSFFGVAAVARCSLWLGSDHLLSVETTGFTERYKRFYFRDIQAVVIRKTEAWKYSTLACLVFIGGLWLAALLIGPGAGRYVFAGLSLPVLIALAVNLALGPTCSCQLRTAVQTETLPSLCRLRRTQKIVERVRPRVTQLQGELAPEQIAVEMQAWLAVEVGMPPVPTGPTPASPNPGDPWSPAGP